MMAELLLQALLPWLARTSLQVGLLVLVILLVQRLFARWLSARARYGLWLLVVLRLCIPYQLEVAGGSWSPAPSGVQRGSQTPASLSLATESNGGALSSLHTPAPRVASKALEQSQPPDPTHATASNKATAIDTPRASLAVPRMLSPQVLPQAEPALAPASSTAGVFSPWRLLLWVWLAGCLLMLLRCSLAEWIFRRRLRGAELVSDERVLLALEEARRALGLKRSPACVQTTALQSPAVHGLWHKRLLLPAQVLESFSSAELRLLFLHELSHVRRRDVELNLLLVLLSAVYWFHPLVHLALARLRGAQEALRDWEALASSAGPSPQLYAGTLIKLIEGMQTDLRPARGVGFLLHARSIKERIQMIKLFSSAKPRFRFLGGLLALPLAWMAFTRAAPVVELPGQTQGQSILWPASASPDGQAGLRQIVVASHQELPRWQQEVEERMQERIDLVLKNASLSQAVQKLRELSGLNYVVAPNVQEDIEARFDISLADVSVADALDLICRSLDAELDHCLAGESIYLGYRDSLPRTYLTYVYNIAELIEEANYADREEALEHLSELLISCVDPESWDLSSVSASAWGGLLVVSQTAKTQAGVNQFLNLLLNHGVKAQELVDSREAALAEQLASLKLSVDYDAEPMPMVVSDLRERYGLELFVQPEYMELLVTLKLKDIHLSSMLGFLAGACELNLWTQRGRVYLTEGCDATTIEAHAIADLLESYESETGMDFEEGLDGLREIIRESVSPHSWDNWGEMWGWNNLLIVRQSKGIQGELKAFLGDLRQAVR